MPRTTSFFSFFLTAVGFASPDLLVGQNHCRVRYQHNAACDRIQRDRYCWIPGEGTAQENDPHSPGRSRGTLEHVHMAVSPNPAMDRSHISFTETEIVGSLELISATGAVALTQSVLASPFFIDVRDVSNGAYFLRFTSGQECIISSCIVQH